MGSHFQSQGDGTAATAVALVTECTMDYGCSLQLNETWTSACGGVGRCTLWLHAPGLSITGNSAKKDGGQLYSTCAGDLFVVDTALAMAVGECVASQVRVHALPRCQHVRVRRGWCHHRVHVVKSNCLPPEEEEERGRVYEGGNACTRWSPRLFESLRDVHRATCTGARHWCRQRFF